MSSGIDDLLYMVDDWKFALQDRLKRMASTERRSFWNQIHEKARKEGLHVAEAEKPPKRTVKRVRRAD